MSSNASNNTPLSIRLSPSRYLRNIISVTYLSGLILLWWLPISIELRVFISLLLVADFARHWQCYIRLNHLKSLKQVVWQGEGEWDLFLANGTIIKYQTLSQSITIPYLVILNFSSGHHLILLVDSTDKQVQRRLRVLLRSGDG